MDRRTFTGDEEEERWRVARLQVEVECGPVSLYSGGAGPCSVSVKDVEVQDLFGRSCKSALPTVCACAVLSWIIQ